MTQVDSSPQWGSLGLCTLCQPVNGAPSGGSLARAQKTKPACSWNYMTPSPWLLSQEDREGGREHCSMECPKGQVGAFGFKQNLTQAGMLKG